MAQYSPRPSLHALSSDSLEQPPAYSQHEGGDPENDVHLATLEEKKRRWWRNALINTAFIASWSVCNVCYKASGITEPSLVLDSLACNRYFFATILSVYNKWMFSPEHFGFPFPLFVTMMHMYVQFAMAAVLRVAWPHKFRPEHSPLRKDYA